MRRILRGLIPALMALQGPICAQTQVDLKSQGKRVDFSEANSTKPFRMGTSLPASCSVGEAFFKVGAPEGRNLFGCTSTDTWTELAPGADLPISEATAEEGQMLRWNAVAGFWEPRTLTQQLSDIEGISGKQGAGGLLQAFGGGTVQEGECAQFDADGNLVSAGKGCGEGDPNYSQSFTLQTSVDLNHGLGTMSVLAQCYDTAGRAVEPDTVTLADLNRATVTFATVQSGACVVNATGGGGSAAVGGGDVSSVFGRAGVVAAQSGDYSFPQIAGSLAAAQIAAADRQGTGARVQMSGGGSVAANDCAMFDAGGNVVSAGAACGSGGGGGGEYVAGFGIAISGGVISLETAAVPTFLTGAGSLDFPAVAQSNCADMTFPLPGANIGDSVAAGWPPDFEAGLTGTMHVSSTDTITVRLCRIAAGSVDPPNKSYRATIIRSF